MNRGYARIKSRVADALGTAVLSRQFAAFAGVHTCFLIFTNLHGIFINTLLIRLTNDSSVTLWYNVIFYFCFAVSMPLGAIYMRKTSPSVSSRTGIFLYILMYIAFFALMFTGKLSQGVPLIAVLSAFAATAYWIAYNVMLIEFSGENERDVAISLMGMSGGLVSMVMPTLSGVVIAAFRGMTGYYVMFGISLAVAVLTILLSITKVPAIASKTRRTYFKIALHDIVTTRVWRICMTCEFVKGLREGTFAFFLNVLLFELVKNEALIGLNTFLSALLAILANWTISRFLRPAHRVRWILTSVTVLFTASLLLFFKLDTMTVILMSVINAFFNITLLNPITSILFSLFGRTAHGAQAKYEFLGIKDLCLGIGRGVGVIIVLLFPRTQTGYLVAICVLTATQYLTAFLASRTVRELQREDAAADEAGNG